MSMRWGVWGLVLASCTGAQDTHDDETETGDPTESPTTSTDTTDGTSTDTDTGTTPAVTDAPTIGNRLVAPDDPRLAGMFNLGPEDYYIHSEKMGAAPAVVHSFVDWVDADAIASATADPTTRVEPIPVDELGMEIWDYVYSPGTIVALTWAMPLPNYDVPGSSYEAIPRMQHILDGDYDEHIDDFAQAIDALDVPVMLTLFGEIDNNAFYGFGPEGLHAGRADDDDLPPEWRVPVADDLTGHYGDPTLPDGPERVRDTFIYVIDRFRAAGVDDVSWFMYASSGFQSVVAVTDDAQLVDPDNWWNAPEYYYPGDEYIDWVGKSLHHDDLDDLPPKFEHAYHAWGKVTQRPFFSPEFSINGGFGETSREDVIRDEFGDYFLRFARVKCLATTDQDPATGNAEFGLTTLGGVDGEFPGEVDAWQETVVAADAWRTVPYAF